ncbi:hypothetical protein [Verrucosispora sp. TAA-831]|uniref:hypothetical protein n=1 Tax=Verrucosispora sp. TAA-831 TaxID=3422227 RepID=UPI003D6F257E
MGRADASSIFDRVADALIAENAADTLKRNVLGPLIDALRDADWDTWGESRERYANDLVIAELFAKLGHEIDGNGVYGEIDFADSAWSLRCSRHGLVGGGTDTPGEHDRLVRLWAQHDHELHGGDGAVDTDVLIDPQAVID